MDNNENNTQEFAPQDGGYTKAPTNQGNVPPVGQGTEIPQGQFTNQQNAGFQSSGQFNGQQMNAGQPYGGQGYVPQQKEPKGFAIAGMVLGIVSIVCCCSPFVGGITGILGLIFSIMVLAQKRPGKGMAIAGVICAAIGLVLVISMFFANNSLMEYIKAHGGMDSFMNQLEQENDFY